MTTFLAPPDDLEGEAWARQPTPSKAMRLHRAGATPSGLSADTGSAETLPPELLREASVRLGWAGLIYAGGYLMAYWAPFAFDPVRQAELSVTQAQSVFALASIVLGLLVFGLSRRAELAPAKFLNVGLGFAILGALGISLAEFWRGFPRVASPLDYLGVPWECVWILIVPLVAPNTPRKILMASLAQASTGPLVVAFVTLVRGLPLDVSVATIASYFAFTTYLCAFIAYVIARIVFRYGVRLKKAREVGSYVLVDRLGSGGMGEVWIARHRMLARPAAIKLIRPELLGPDAECRQKVTTRFAREARATAALGSKHTVDVYDFGLTDEGAFFYVMELLDGLSLDALVCRFGPVQPARAVHLLAQVCHSLGEAHARGLIHRDIKPANIFSCRLGPDVDFVKVLDFGLVKELDQQNTQLTQQGSGPGTPAYMAPEVAMGETDVDERADIYAVGCVAYWLLTGTPVFQAETPMATLLAHVQKEPEPPSRRAPFAVSPALDALILACLAKDPADRPASAADLSRRLAALGTAHPWNPDAARDWWDQHLPQGSNVEPAPAAEVAVASY